jgi:5-hydroxytryptamine receptor 2
VVVAVKIVAVWLISVLIACPLIALGVYRPADILSTDGQCAIFNSYFLVYGSLAAFFGPLGIMLVTYTLTIRLLSRRARQVEMIARQGMRRSITRRR